MPEITLVKTERAVDPAAGRERMRVTFRLRGDEVDTEWPIWVDETDLAAVEGVARRELHRVSSQVAETVRPAPPTPEEVEAERRRESDRERKWKTNQEARNRSIA